MARRGGRLRVVVAGMVAGDPFQGGATWAVLQYVLGLERLGHDVFLFEPVRELTGDRARYFRHVVREFGLDGRAALVGGEATIGTTPRDADALLNISGLLRDPGL